MPSALRKLVLAIDQGTTSSRAIIFDAAGTPIAVCQKEHRQIFPAAAWVEHDAEEIWARVSECITGALASAGATPDALAAVGITNQRETVVVWDPATVRSSVALLRDAASSVRTFACSTRDAVDDPIAGQTTVQCTSVARPARGAAVRSASR